MEFKEVISITGMPGLFQLVSSKSNGIIVKSLEDGKSQFVSSRMHPISSLDSITVYLQQEETTELKNVFNEMLKKENEVPLPESKSTESQLRAYMKQVVPKYDEEKVHVSDLKKMVRWFGVLKQHNLLPVKEETETKKEEEATTEKS